MIRKVRRSPRLERLWLCAAWICLMTGPAAAVVAPKQLYNKSIVISWNESSSNKHISDGRMVSLTVRIDRTIYISNAGRAFIRATGSAGGYVRSGEAGPEMVRGNVNFTAGALVLHSPNLTVVRQITANFDPAFSSCTGSVIVGKSGPSPKWIGVDGSPYEMLSVNVGSASCSIRDGNSFAGQ